MIEETLQEIVNAIENININPDNSFGQPLGDVVQELVYQVSRMAEALEKIEVKMK